uniref:Uncharacterized protein n=1 Tax=Arundo donax TaxID=35708 RepID=A0A0A9BUS3_ARUDO
MEDKHAATTANRDQQFPGNTKISSSSCNNEPLMRLPFPALVSLLLLQAQLPSLAAHTGSCAEQDKSCLLRFLAGLSRDGGLAVSWRNSTDCCSWQGITCNGDGTVIEMSLPHRGLEGQVSPALGGLTGLSRLNLSHNSLSGGLPFQQLMSSSSIVVLDVSFNWLNGGLLQDQSWSMSSPELPLQVLNISSNLFVGEFPSATCKAMKNLVALNASNNSFTGGIPTHFCNISRSFAILDISHNQFSGSVPPGLVNCSMLRVLNAGHNNLSGALLDELFSGTPFLEHLSLRSNALRGTLDGSHTVKLIILTTLDLGGNKFSGKIPDSIGQLKRLEELYLDSNSMYGELPSALGNCTNLTTIDLKSNSLNGDLGKINFSNLLNLKTLDLYMNNFTGAIPESIYSCSHLTALRLSANHFNGELSPGLGNLKYLTFLSLGNNSFANITNALQILKSCRNLTILLVGGNFMGEAIPQDETIDGFENLRFLNINRCSLFGRIPIWLSKLTHLEMLIISNNRLTGPIPGWINSLSHLFYLDVSNNSLTGEIPITLMEMPMLKSVNTSAYLDPRHIDLSMYRDPSLQYHVLTAFPTFLNISYNNFIGVIPQQIGQIKMLAILDFIFSNLSGHIPETFCNLTNLQVLDLSSNHLTGAIPLALNKLHFLSAFNVSNNELEGPIPTGGQFDTFDSSSFDGNTELCGSILLRQCDSAEVVPVSRLSSKRCSVRVMFSIAFGMFFGVGVLLDHIVLSRLRLLQF